MKNDISTPFKYDCPGRAWMKPFMKRNKLSFKKASMICISQKSNTANPFVIYNFYDKLATIFDTSPDLNRDNIRNCDESGFPTDPGKSKVIAPRNKLGFKLSYGLCRENITTLAVCNATGKVLDPLIIFQGKNFQSSWRGDMALPNTFLPHMTDILQPLDKCCFGPLKRKWEDKLNARINQFGLTKKVDKAEFVNQISSIWHIGMKESNVIAGFETTCIWPLNKEKYDKSHFDIRLFEKYQKWVEPGKPELDWVSYTNTAQEPSTADFKNFNESSISLDKSATKKISLLLIKVLHPIIVKRIITRKIF